MYLQEKTFLDLATTLAGCEYTGNGSKYQGIGLAEFMGRNTFVRLGFGKSYNPNNKEYDGLLRFMGYLSAMNHKAYRTRYGFKEAYGFMKFPRSLEYGTKISIYQVLKSLECIKYNLDDFQSETLDKLIEGVKDALINNIREYNSATWG